MARRPQIVDATSPRQTTKSAALAESERNCTTASVQRIDRIHFPVVGIVASAGGLAAFNHFLKAMPTDSGVAIVVIPHLDAKHKSLMVELLSRQTTMPVVEASDGAAIEANCVYVIPPNHVLTMEQGTLRLGALPEPAGSQTAIDIFLRSLATDQGERAIGIVLSGTGSHGTLGIREIKRCGGMAMAQSLESAEFEQMPRSAIETGLVDFVLPPEQMAEALVSYVQQPYVSLDSHAEVPSEITIKELDSILKRIREQTKVDFSSYRTNMLLRRIERRMGLMQVAEMSDYLQVLQESPAEVQSLCKDFLIGVTAFFREPAAFAVLERDVIPALVAKHTSETPIRVWVPGCATGEEAYSISITLIEALTAANKSVNFQVFASDINDDSIEFARRGLYPASVASDISADRLRKFFVPADDVHYRVNKQLRDSIVFSKQNLISDAPFSKMDLISCRNLLIYLEPEVQQKLISLFHFALNENGFLTLGPAETIGRELSLFDSISREWRVYSQAGPAKSSSAMPASVSRFTKLTVSQTRTSTVPRKSYKELAERLILSDYSPATVLINRQHEILYVTGRLVDFLEFPAGEMSKNLLEMARPGLRTKLRGACHTAIQSKAEVTENARVKRSGAYGHCSITVRPIFQPNDTEGLMLVILQDRKASQPHDDTTDGSPAVSSDGDTSAEMSLVSLLEYELKTTREEVQNTLEQMGSSNEELQSSNEELESSKEELQSLNEELNTVNCQLLEKVTELDQSNGEIVDLMASTEIATLYLDKQLRVKRFTRPAIKLLDCKSANIGRFLSELESPLLDQGMLADCKQVLGNQQHVENEIETTDGECFLRRILPFCTEDNQSLGIVVTFIDMTQQNQTQKELQASEERTRRGAERLRAILDTASDAIVTFDSHGTIDSVNHATESIFGYSSSEAIGMSFNLLMTPAFRKGINGVVQPTFANEQARIPGESEEVICQKKDGSSFPAELSVLRVDRLELFTGVLRDISKRKALQQHVLEIAADEQRRIGVELHDGTQQELTGLTLYANAILETLKSAQCSQPGGESNGESSWIFSESDYERLQTSTAIMAQRLSEANRHVRDLAHGIMPVQVDSEGLKSALSELVASTNSKDVQCRFDCSGKFETLDNTTATHLYRIAQEAVNNSLRHGAANHIVISLMQRGGRITLEVDDDGIGFNPVKTTHRSSKASGVGLQTMEYRANLIGGSFDIENKSSGGTSVKCSILQDDVDHG